MSDKKNRKKKSRIPVDMRVKRRKLKKEKPKIDYFTNLEPKLLLRIISHVPMSSFLDVSQTHSHLRRFMCNFAAEICNLSILTRFPTQAKYLAMTKVEGWLVPTIGLPNITLDKETRWVVPGMQLQVYEPGPQVLYFMEKKVISYSMVELTAMRKFLDELNGESYVVYGGRDYPRWVWLQEMIWYHGVPS